MASRVIAFTGHRKYTNQSWVAGVLESVIIAAIKKGYTDFISGMAKGVDQLAIQILIKHRSPDIRIIAARPFLEHGLTRDELLLPYAKLLMACNEVHVIGQQYDTSTYLMRDRWMVDNADAIVAVLDNRGKGGTQWTYDYALHQSKPVFRINPEDKTMGWIQNKPT